MRVDAGDARADERERTADERERIADERERIADEREAWNSATPPFAQVVKQSLRELLQRRKRHLSTSRARGKRCVVVQHVWTSPRRR